MFLISGILFSGVGIGIFWIAKRHLATHPEGALENTEPPICFSPVDYMSRIEETCEMLWAEPKEEYIPVLWWGLEGLRLNKDGTREWISRANTMPKPDAHRAYMRSSMCNALPRATFQNLQTNASCLLASSAMKLESSRTYNSLDYLNIAQSSCCDTTLSRALALETQITNLRLQAASMEQGQTIIERLNQTGLCHTSSAQGFEVLRDISKSKLF